MKLGLVIAGLLAVGVGPSAAAAPPKVSQLIVYRDGSAVAKTVSTRATQVGVGGHRCTASAVPSPAVQRWPPTPTCVARVETVLATALPSR